MTKKNAVLAGDGIGPEIVAEAMKVLEVLRDFGFKFEAEHAPIGGAGYDAAGDPLPNASLKLAQKADAVLLGAVGGPIYDTLPRDKRPERGLLRIRKELNLFANLRPALLYPELAHDHYVEPGHDLGLQARCGGELGIKQRRPQVRKQVQFFSDAQQPALGAFVARQRVVFRAADRAQQHGVGLLRQLQARIRQR